MSDLRWGGLASVVTLQKFDARGRPVITGLSSSLGQSIVARSTVPLQANSLGKDVLVICEEGDPTRPIVVGVIQGEAPVASTAAGPVSVEVDDDPLVVTAQRELVLRCGQASITLTRAGKVIIRGTYLLTQSSGYNKIKGASIDIN